MEKRRKSKLTKTSDTNSSQTTALHFPVQQFTGARYEE